MASQLQFVYNATESCMPRDERMNGKMVFLNVLLIASCFDCFRYLFAIFRLTEGQ